MKAIILFALIVITGADVWRVLQPCQQGDESQGFIHSEGGQLLLRYESPDGTKVSEQGILKPNADGSGNVLVKKGSFQFVSPEGTPFSLSYIADEHGYRVKSDSISAASLGADAFFRR